MKNSLADETRSEKNQKILPLIEYPIGLFGDSPVSFNISDLIEITKDEFEKKWEEK